MEGDADPIVRCQSQLRKISVAAFPATAPRNFVENIALDSVAPDILTVVTDTNRRFAAAACARAATQLISGAAEMLTVPGIPLPRVGWSLSETGKRVLALDDHEIMLSFVTINGDVAELEVEQNIGFNRQLDDGEAAATSCATSLTSSLSLAAHERRTGSKGLAEQATVPRTDDLNAASETETIAQSQMLHVRNPTPAQVPARTTSDESASGRLHADASRRFL